MSDFHFACLRSDLQEGKPKCVEIAGVRVAIVLSNEQLHAVSSRCPHAGGPLDRGWIEEGELVCPLHRWRFRLEDGRCTTIRGERIETFAFEVRDEGVWIVL